jgi:hypothetical protein
MMKWKELTNMHGEKLTVNLDQIWYMQRVDDKTHIYFAAGMATITVKELPAEIQNVGLAAELVKT